MAIPIRRIVSGVRDDGHSGIIADGPPPRTVVVNPIRGIYRTDIWSTSEAPVDNSGTADATLTFPAERYTPSPGGTFCFVMEVPPDEPGASPYMHVTDTLDYVVVLQGEIHAVFQDEERLMRSGDICVQRGTQHAWSNRSGEPCLLFAVMIDATPAKAGR